MASTRPGRGTRSEFIFVETLHSGPRVTVQRVAERSSERTALLWAPTTLGRAADLSALEETEEILRILGKEVSVIDAAAAGLDATKALVTPDIGGQPLSTLIPVGGLSVDQVLRVSLAMAVTIQRLHQGRVIHKGIAAPSILINPESGVVELLSHCLASRIPRETRQVVHPKRLEGVPGYISPEQTGRMNRAIDYRTDYYSLGVTMYHMVTGRLPFEGNDPVEMVHAHIARLARPPKALRHDIPDALSGIIMKLTAKNAEDRYQSSIGLIEDLRHCMASLDAADGGGTFELGLHDVFERFRVPEKIYGRDDELGSLIQAFDRVGQGAVEMVLVSGFSGVGKTALVQEIHKPITAIQGFFVSGKHDQYKRNIPYHALASAFRDLVRQLLTESAAGVAEWRRRLNDALQENGQIMVDLVPALDLVMGPQAPVTALPPHDAQQRFNAVFTRFLQVVAGRERPLVLFLDDLQWIDSASLALLRHLATTADDLHLLLVGAYRDNEVDPTHPLMTTVDTLKKGDAQISEIVLSPLGEASIRAIVADTLRCDEDVAARLGSILLAKTGGNPFFLLRFFETLSEEGYLQYDPGARTWTWDQAAIASMDSTENVVDLVVSQLRKLPAATQDVLKMAACIGGTFDLATLSVVTEMPTSEVAAAAWEAVQHGEIIPQNIATTDENDSGRAQTSLAALTNAPDLVRFQFLHDRVQQAAFALVDRTQLKAIHLRIGRLLWKTWAGELDEHVFDIVSHLRQCTDLLDAGDEQRDFAWLCLRAGRRAKGSTAYRAALEYLETGHSLVGDEGWATDYELTAALYSEQAECAYASGDSEKAVAAFEMILANARTPLEKARVCQLRANLAVHAVEYAVALEHTMEGLRLLGTVLPAADDAEGLQALAAKEGEALAPLLEGKEIAALVDLPPMSDPNHLVEADLLNELALVGLFFHPLMIQVATVRMVRLSLEYGNARASGPAYATYGYTLGSALGQYESGYAFGKMALALTQHQHDPLAEAIVCFWFGALNSFWRAPVEESIEVCARGVENGLRIGAPLWIAYSAFFVGVHQLFKSVPIQENIDAFRRYMALQDPHAASGNTPYVQLLEAMQGETASLTGFDEPGWDDAHIVEMREANHLLALQHYFTARLMGDVLMGRTARALDTAKKAAAEGDINLILFGQLTTAQFRFHHALALADHLAEADLDEAEAAPAQEALDACRERLGVWAENAPANFLAQCELVDAAVAVAAGDQVAAMARFDAAIDAAEAHGMTYQVALANERAARFHLANGRRRAAVPYLRAARGAYARWGATAKVEEIEARHGDVFRYVRPGRETERAAVQSDGGFDMASVLKAARIVSGEIELRNLLASAMAVVIENAGAQRGVLLLERDGTLHAEAAVDVDHEDLPSNEVPNSVTDYCRRTNESVVLADAVTDDLFGADPHIVAARPRSVLSMPLLNKGKAIGLLYLENRRLVHAFTSERVQVLEALCAQIAVSIENARVYENLEVLVARRTNELAEAKEAAEHANRVKSAFLASMSHELRTPLNAILGYSELIKDELIDEGMANFAPDLDKINWAGKHLLSLINDILDLSKIEAGKIELYLERFEVCPLVKQVQVAVAPLVDKNGNTLSVTCGDGVGEIHSDQTRIKQILINVLSNAAKFTEQGEVTLDVWRVAGNDGDHVAFRITDTGIGMTPVQLERVFEPFSQADASTTKRFGGSGLGLTISQGFCDMLGGQIHAESEFGVGTTFEVLLPVDSSNLSGLSQG